MKPTHDRAPSGAPRSICPICGSDSISALLITPSPGFTHAYAYTCKGHHLWATEWEAGK